MYGYRQGHENGLLTNLNSISSSLSSLDTIGQSTVNNRASNDNLITLRSHSIASTSLLWNPNGNGGKNGRDIKYSNGKLNGSLMQNGTGPKGKRHHPGSEIYHSGGRKKASSANALTFTLVPLLLLTILRQVIDFLGQIWLQILINFFTIIFLIVALFGIRQRRISYLSLFSLWALFNAAWNLTIICIHTKIRDIGISEDALSLYTGTTSWWRAHGPGCLPYNISSIQPSLSIIQPNMITTGCRVDYHAIETLQAVLHSILSFLSTLICCCLVSSIWRNTTYHQSKTSDKLLRLNNLMNHDRSKINPDPCPSRAGSRYANGGGGMVGNTASLRRTTNRAGSRASQHSVSSMRSSRRRHRQSASGATPRGSTSSQKYGSLSSRRSTSKRGRRSDMSSLTYGTTAGNDRSAGTSQRTRLSSVSSNDYLPSYQPKPSSSNANRLSTYGEISSIDSYNNQRSVRNRPGPSSSRGNTNPTYTGSRSSICSHNTNGVSNNYDDLSYIYGNSNKNSESFYGASSSINGRKQKIYQQSRSGTLEKRNGLTHNPALPQRIQAETYEDTKTKISMTNGSSFAAGQLMRTQHSNGDATRLVEINNNHIYQDNNLDKRNQPLTNGNILPATNGYNSFDNRSRITDSASANQHNHQQQVYSRHLPIYSNNQAPNGNQGETPI